jgi:hypothetical protein
MHLIMRLTKGDISPKDENNSPIGYKDVFSFTTTK